MCDRGKKDYIHILRLETRWKGMVIIMKKIVIIGLGDVSYYVIAAIMRLSNYQIVGICDKDAEKVKKISIPGVSSYYDYKDMINSQCFDYVVLLVHHSNRMNILLELLESGYKVICEKPLACSPYELEMIIETCDKNNNYPIVMYHRSYNKNIDALYDLLNTGCVNSLKIYYLEDISIQSSNERYKYLDDIHGGGCVQDNFPNCIHYLINYGNVTLQNSNKIITNYCTSADIHLLLNGEIECTIFLDWHSNVDEKSIVAYTDKGIVKYDLQCGYDIPKKSLIDEYVFFFNHFEEYDKKKLSEIDIRIVKLIDEILS